MGAWDHLCLEATHRLIQSSIRQRSLHIYCEPTHPSRPGTQRALPPGSLNPTRGAREGPALSTDVRYIMEHPRQRGRQGTFNHLCVQITATTAGNTYVTPSIGPAVRVGLQTHIHSFFAPPARQANYTHFTGEETEVRMVGRVPQTCACVSSSPRWIQAPFGTPSPGPPLLRGRQGGGGRAFFLL